MLSVTKWCCLLIFVDFTNICKLNANMKVLVWSVACSIKVHVLLYQALLHGAQCESAESAKPSGSQRVVYTTAYTAAFS